MKELDRYLYRLNNCIGDDKEKQIEVLEGLIQQAKYEIEQIKSFIEVTNE